MTAREFETVLVKLIIVGAVLALVVLGVIKYTHQANQANVVMRCTENAPLGWDCANHPTGYPTSLPR